jgi:two-component system, chemotaxis family, response regulator Rcp1
VKILLVEDNPADVGLVEEAFRENRFKHEIHVAENGVLALEFLRKQGKFSSAPVPDIVLLDLNLPKKDGREVLAEIKEDPSLREIPVIVLTTSNDDADVQKAYHLHANCYLTKPVDVDDFTNKVRSIEDFWLRFVRLPTHGEFIMKRGTLT